MLRFPGLRVRSSSTGKKVFFYRYRSQDGALREIILGDVGPLTLAKARDAAMKKRLERQQGIDPQLEKRKAREEVMRERAVEASASTRSAISSRNTSRKRSRSRSAARIRRGCCGGTSFRCSAASRRASLRAASCRTS